MSKAAASTATTSKAAASVTGMRSAECTCKEAEVSHTEGSHDKDGSSDKEGCIIEGCFGHRCTKPAVRPAAPKSAATKWRHLRLGKQAPLAKQRALQPDSSDKEKAAAQLDCSGDE